MADAAVNVVHCPTTALKVSYGITQVGKFPEMVQQGMNVSIGTDGNNASNYSDLMRATYLVAGLFWADAQRMGESITARSGLPDKAKFPLV